MELLLDGKLKLKKSVHKGDTESLLSLFGASERFKRFEVLTDADEGTRIKVSLEEAGEIELKLGVDIEKGQQKCIMTLFWYEQRIIPFEVKKNIEADQNITLKMWKI